MSEQLVVIHNPGRQTWHGSNAAVYNPIEHKQFDARRRGGGVHDGGIVALPNNSRNLTVSVAPVNFSAAPALFIVGSGYFAEAVLTEEMTAAAVQHTFIELRVFEADWASKVLQHWFQRCRLRR